MEMYEELIAELREEAEWAKANEWETPIMLSDHLTQAADAIEELTGFVQEAERDRDEYRERLDKANDAIEKLSKKYLASEVDNTNLTGWLAEEYAKHLWIPVTKRLPEEDEVVLVWGGASVYTAKRHNKYGAPMWWKLNSKQHYCNPTHWMPLPEPPEEK